MNSSAVLALEKSTQEESRRERIESIVSEDKSIWLRMNQEAKSIADLVVWYKVK